MFDLSWGEVFMIGAVALIVIGPKDLPGALRTVGRLIGKLRRMASEFQGQFNEALREADLDQVRRDVEGLGKATSGVMNPAKLIRDEVKGAIDGSGKAAAAAAATPKPAAEPQAPAQPAAPAATSDSAPVAPAAPAPAAAPAGSVEPAAAPPVKPAAPPVAATATTEEKNT